MIPLDRQKAVNKAAYQLLAIQTPAVILIVVTMLFWRLGRGRGERWPAPWEFECVVAAFAVCAVAILRFYNTLKALGVPPFGRPAGRI